MCNKSFSFIAKLLAPIAQFAFCMVALVFALLHPSVVFVPLIPLTILAFFTDLKQRSACQMFGFARGLMLIFAMTFTMTLYVYNLIQLQQNDTLLAKWKSA